MLSASSFRDLISYGESRVAELAEINSSLTLVCFIPPLWTPIIFSFYPSSRMRAVPLWPSWVDTR